jgi:iron complex transport system ATP-binding protein
VTAGPVLEAEGFTCLRGGRPVLNRVSFSVERGEFLAVTGPNGAGKSTLLQCLLRMVPGTEGALRVDGRPLRSVPQRELARLMAYVPQADARGVAFRVEEFVLLGRYPHWSRFAGLSEADRRAVREALEVTGTTPFARRPVASLSGGERQKVFIAAALAQEAPVLLLDEPTTFLDPKHQADVCVLLRRLHKERGATVVMVTHDINLAALCADRVLALKQGEAAFLGAPSEFLRPEVLDGIYGVSFRVAQNLEGRAWAFHAGWS